MSCHLGKTERMTSVGIHWMPSKQSWRRTAHRTHGTLHGTTSNTWIQRSTTTQLWHKQPKETEKWVSSRLIDRMFCQSGFSAPNSTHSCHEGAGRKFGGHIRATQRWWFFLMNMSHPVIHINNKMIWRQGRSIVSPGDRNHGRTRKRVKTRKMRLGMLRKSAKSQRKR